MSISSFQEQLVVILMFPSTAASWDALNEGLWGWSALIPSMHPFKSYTRVCGDTAHFKRKTYLSKDNPEIMASEKHLKWLVWMWLGATYVKKFLPCLSFPTYCWSCVRALFSSSDRFLWVKTQETARLHSNLVTKAATHLKGNLCLYMFVIMAW